MWSWLTDRGADTGNGIGSPGVPPRCMANDLGHGVLPGPRCPQRHTLATGLKHVPHPEDSIRQALGWSAGGLSAPVRPACPVPVCGLDQRQPPASACSDTSLKANWAPWSEALSPGIPRQ